MNTEDHWREFTRFCRLELASGGPDPQVKIVAQGTAKMSRLAAAYAAGCFVAPYTCGGGAVLWGYNTDQMEEEPLTGWIARNWDGIPHRRERRAIDQKAGRKLARCLKSWQAWTEVQLPVVEQESYVHVYRSVRDRVDFFGRYAAMKVLEVLHQRGLVLHAQNSICAVGATYPRLTLANLCPEYAEVLTSDSGNDETVLVCDLVAQQVKNRLGVDMSWYDFETLLCNYRQSLAGKYPGRSHDRELAHWLKAEAWWGRDKVESFLPFYAIRKRLFPHEFLGEIGGWGGARPALEAEWKAQYAHL